MKRRLCTLGILVCLALFFAAQTLAAGPLPIDLSCVQDGYFTVYCESSAAMKVGVTLDGKTVYHNYAPGTQSAYALTRGSGSYTITLYEHLRGNSYRAVNSTRVNVVLDDVLSPYLVSTYDITYSDTDAVGLTADELCRELDTDEEKLVAIHNFIATTFRYDRNFAQDVRTGRIKTHTPDTNALLESKLGVCCDFSSLFAAMCRSQGIPCAVATGYYQGGYHAWNMVCLDGEWIPMDLTRAVSQRITDADSLSDCVISLQSYSGYSF